MRTNTHTGRGKHIFVDGSDPILACVSRPKSLRASEVAPVHTVTARIATVLPVFPASESEKATAENAQGDGPCLC